MILQRRAAAAAALVMLLGAAPSAASWLDSPKPPSWQTATIPHAPQEDPASLQDIAPGGRCVNQLRRPAFPEDRAVVTAGWKLIGGYQSFSGTTIILGTAATDGMCRPIDYQGFVFRNGIFAGTLSPHPTSSRNDGAIGPLQLFGSGNFSVDYPRYTQQDALCCPSRTSTATFTVVTVKGRPTLHIESIDTRKNASP